MTYIINKIKDWWEEFYFVKSFKENKIYMSSDRNIAVMYSKKDNKIKVFTNGLTYNLPIMLFKNDENYLDTLSSSFDDGLEDLSLSSLQIMLKEYESLEEYEAGKTHDVVKTQVVAAFKDVTAEAAERVVIAYEPIWAIGTGKTATNEIAEDVCGYIRGVVAELYGQDVAEKVRIQYGGSVKPATLKALLEQPNIDGALVGGASLQVESYVAMIEALND